MIEHSAIRGEVANILGDDISGHDMDHVDRVYRLSMRLAQKEGANLGIVGLAALLHDVDDYKLVGNENAKKLTNATNILDRYRVDNEMARRVLQIIPSMGYNKYIEGVRPSTLEGHIVSDADMCDAIGSHGLIRVFEYNATKGRPFFDKTIPPATSGLSADDYRASGNLHAVQHFFDKLLLIPDILLTESGREEGRERAAIMQHYLKELFREEGADDWAEYLDNFLAEKG